MMNILKLSELVSGGGIDGKLELLYGKDNIEDQKKRYLLALSRFGDVYGKDRDVNIYSVAGRTEIAGNHTDHNSGKVIAGSLDLDIIAVAAPSAGSTVRVLSEGFGEDTIDIEKYNSPDPEKYCTSGSIIAGVCAGFEREGYKTGGFDAYATSNVLKGSGMSSSAAFEDMIGNILNHIYNSGEIDNVNIAMISQYAENEFFEKPCGLMDQVACAVGGIVSIDFEKAGAPLVERIDFDMSGAGYNLCIINTGGNHADLGEDYASVPSEMKAVASHFGKKVLREVSEEEIISAIPSLREKTGDRAILRALHFCRENGRVDLMKKALRENDIEAFFRGVTASGHSSFSYLQNVYTTKNLAEQGLSLALCLADGYLSGKKAAFRVHGGGFAGTIQAFVPSYEAVGFKKYMEAAFGEGTCLILRIRPEGALKVI